MAPDGQHWDVGAYVLGVLDPTDVEPFEAHLAACDYCADEVSSLLPIVGGLAGLDVAAVVRDERPALTSVPSLDSGAAGRRARALPRHGQLVSAAIPRGRILVAAGTAAVLISGASFLVGTQWAPGATALAASTHQPEVRASATAAREQFDATDAKTGVHAHLDVTPAKWGMQVQMSVDGVRGPLRCELIAVDTSGASTVVASWTVGEPGYGIVEQPSPLRLDAASSATVSTTRRFEIRGTDPSGSTSTLVKLPV